MSTSSTNLIITFSDSEVESLAKVPIINLSDNDDDLESDIFWEDSQFPEEPEEKEPEEEPEEDEVKEITEEEFNKGKEPIIIDPEFPDPKNNKASVVQRAPDTTTPSQPCLTKTTEVSTTSEPRPKIKRTARISVMPVPELQKLFGVPDLSDFNKKPRRF